MSFYVAMDQEDRCIEEESRMLKCADMEGATLCLAEAIRDDWALSFDEDIFGEPCGTEAPDSNHHGCDNTTVRPFLKWVGGKTRLLPSIRQRIPEFRRYHEVCLGGGAVFFDLWSRGMIKEDARLYDLNDDLVRTYEAIKSDPQGVLDRLNGHRACHTERFFHELRNVHPRDLSDVETAARLIYLNRACFNGVHRVNRSGLLKSSWGGRAEVTFDRANLLAVSKALRTARLIQGDFAVVLEHANAGDFCYIDPPYPDGFVKYTAVGFDGSDHSRLRDVCLELHKRGVRFLQSNADCSTVRSLYDRFHVQEVEVRRSVSRRGDGRGMARELLIANY